ncbi:hypothetical protein O6P43_026155 [Quillaja saponaria]|uniref:Uncharacterized protein n=1 Tax=Quillaja saponaria TaxID=32244 RepID=A0AAD7LB48_QUISA|nr:hypothetical protein O6P43_026155 [Quillaja saponaria]
MVTKGLLQEDPVKMGTRIRKMKALTENRLFALPGAWPLLRSDLLPCSSAPYSSGRILLRNWKHDFLIPSMVHLVTQNPRS